MRTISISRARRILDELHEATLVSRRLGDMYAQACHMGDEIESQRRLIDRDRSLERADRLESLLREALIIEWVAD